ncbi:hypothetical protein EVAR_79170_1 [Eumeta japonica]|uniref:Uncharacterized protein n=1 Tax=Eumeta variegata TaxID=151549 RepID=A0A4C1UT30_EUMVA|nr:hypothetical protein EVAR_79170_1 [Eumeta japonica]
MVHDSGPRIAFNSDTVRVSDSYKARWVRVPVGHSLSRPSINTTPSIGYSIRFQEHGNALVTPLGLRIFMSGGDRLPTDGSPADLSFDYVIKKRVE